MNRNAILTVLILAVACGAPPARAKMTEKNLARLGDVVLARIIEDNPDREEDIRRLFGGVVMEGSRGIRLKDKFGMFMSSMEKKGIELKKTYFFRRREAYALFFAMKDGRDGQLYTLFLEYELDRKSRCVLGDIYFSIVFEERMGEIRGFFETR